MSKLAKFPPVMLTWVLAPLPLYIALVMSLFI